MQQKTINYFDLNDMPLCDESLSKIADRFNPDTEIAMIKVRDLIIFVTDDEDLEYLRGQMKSFGNFWVKL